MILEILVVLVLVVAASLPVLRMSRRENLRLIRTPEDAKRWMDRKHVERLDEFTLNIAWSPVLDGRPDTMGVVMALITNDILGRGFLPVGIVQKIGYRAYHYSKPPIGQESKQMAVYRSGL